MKKIQKYQWKRNSTEVEAIKTKEKYILTQHINSDHRVGGSSACCVCVCVVAGFSVQPAAQANEAIIMLVSEPLPAGETSQVKREKERGGGGR